MLADVIGQLLSLGVGVAISPVPVVGVVLVLSAPAGRRNAAAFLAGWVAGLAVVGVAATLLVGAAGSTDDGGRARWTGALELVLGLLLAGLSLREWRARPSDADDAALPGWMAAIDGFGPGRIVGLGALLAAVNPKNLMLTVAAGASVAQADLPTGSAAVALAVFVVVGTLGPGLPVVVAVGLGARSAPLLAHLRGWMVRHEQAIMAVLLLVIGVKLVGDGLGVLAG